MSGFCTGAVLASRGGAGSAFKAGLVGGIILAVIEGLNIGLVRVFSNMGPVEEAPAMTGAAPDAGQHDAAEQPWWAKLIPMPSAPKEVDFSDPKEVRAPFAPSLPTSQCLCLAAPAHARTHTDGDYCGVGVDGDDSGLSVSCFECRLSCFILA